MQYFKFRQIIPHRNGYFADSRKVACFRRDVAITDAYCRNRAVVVDDRHGFVRRSPFYVFLTAVKTYDIQLVSEYHIGRDNRKRKFSVGGNFFATRIAAVIAVSVFTACEQCQRKYRQYNRNKKNNFFHLRCFPLYKLLRKDSMLVNSLMYNIPRVLTYDLNFVFITDT